MIMRQAHEASIMHCYKHQGAEWLTVTLLLVYLVDHEEWMVRYL